MPEAEFNANLDFFQRITADQYVLCANGEHEKPDLGIVEAIFEARRGSAPYKLWFSNSDVTVLASIGACRVGRLVTLTRPEICSVRPSKTPSWA